MKLCGHLILVAFFPHLINVVLTALVFPSYAISSDLDVVISLA